MKERVDVKALMFRHNLAREAAATIGGRVDRHAFVSRLAPVRIEDVEELPLPAGTGSASRPPSPACAART